VEVRVVTMRYSEGVQGFPEDALRRVCAGREVIDVSEHFFLYGNVPHLTLVVKLGDAILSDSGSWRERSHGAPDLELELPDEKKGIYRALKVWRNERSKKEGKPAYAIARNTLVLEIVKAMPQTLAALKEIDGVGEAMVTNYGSDILAILANAPQGATSEKSLGEPKKGLE